VSFPLTYIFPSVKVTSSSSWVFLSHPACSMAGVINLVQMSLSERCFLFMGKAVLGYRKTGGCIFVGDIAINNYYSLRFKNVWHAWNVFEGTNLGNFVL